MFSGPLKKGCITVFVIPDQVGNDEKRNDFAFRHTRESGHPFEPNVFQQAVSSKLRMGRTAIFGIPDQAWKDKKRPFLRWLLLPVLMTGLSSPSLGCAVCFGNQESSLTQGMNMGILALLGFILPVLLGMASFVGYLAWRAHHPLQVDESVSSFEPRD